MLALRSIADQDMYAGVGGIEQMERAPEVTIFDEAG